MTEDSKSNSSDGEDKDYSINFVTSSAISNMSIKFLAFYIPIIWFGGSMTVGAIYTVYIYLPLWLLLPLLPFLLFGCWYVFIFGLVIFSKLFLVFINLIHLPKEGIFPAVKGNSEFEFWRLRIEIKKLAIWVLRNNPLPWSDAWAFRWFGVKMDFSSHLQDAWVDMEFMEFGHNCLVGQDSIVMSSMVVGNYLIIKKIFVDDFAIIGGITIVGPGTKMGKDSLQGAVSISYDQKLDAGWIYFGQPVRKLKPNRLAISKIVQTLVDEARKIEVEIETNIDEDKKHLIQENIPEDES